MADSNDDASGLTGDGETGGAGARVEPPKSVVDELVDAARSAAESLLEEQKRQIAERVGGIAEALHSAAHSLENSQNTLIARYVEETADRVEDISRQVRDRHWNEIVSDTEDFARRQPTLFVLGAMATGFLMGRFLWARTSEQRQASEAARELSQRETASNVTAAVSSASGTGVGEAAGDGLTPSGAREPS
jgi:ElaB/YqjD/DUF883 family membrane-anchored ribosome-binding protein